MQASEKVYALVECTRSGVDGDGGTGLKPRGSSHSAGDVSIRYFPTTYSRGTTRKITQDSISRPFPLLFVYLH